MPLKRKLAVFCLLLAAAACGGKDGAGKGGVPEKAPNFELKDLSGKTVRLSDFQGKVVLLDFWATYCVPCHESIPVFQGIYDKNKARGLETVGISLDAFTEEVPGFVKKYRMSYTVLLDPEGASQEAYGVRGLPSTFLIDRKGVVRGKWLGFDPTVASEVGSAVQALLQE